MLETLTAAEQLFVVSSGGILSTLWILMGVAWRVGN